jgi:hypothetical protein
MKRPADYIGVAHYALSPDSAERLWNISLGLVSDGVPS